MDISKFFQSDELNLISKVHWYKIVILFFLYIKETKFYWIIGMSIDSLSALSVNSQATYNQIDLFYKQTCLIWKNKPKMFSGMRAHVK